MKPKPLDLGKVYEVLMKEEDNEFTKVVKVKDVEGAVEWLKKEIRLSEYYKSGEYKNITFYDYILKKIDEAFDKKEDENGK